MEKKIHLHTVIPEDLSGKRLDQALAFIFNDYSRGRIQDWIRNGSVKLNGQVPRQKQVVHNGDTVEIHAELQLKVLDVPEKIPLDIIYEDKQIIILNKPAGLVVHPGAGNREHTLLNALLNHDQRLNKIPRAGIVQRLDKDTTGIMIVARTLNAHTDLVDQLQKRSIHREYQAIVSGVMTAGGTIDLPLGRHPRKRTHMAVVENGKEAITHFRIIRKFRTHTHLRINLETGRTHQIRVHLAHLKYPILGDPVYAGRARLPKGASDELVSEIRNFPRQALHAASISLIHPESQETMKFECPLPADMQHLLEVLDKYDS